MMLKLTLIAWCVLVIVSPVYGADCSPDADGNGFRDDYEEILANMFCPSFVFPKEERDRWGVNTKPEPVEIVTGTMYETLRSLATTEYVGELIANVDLQHNYTWVNNDPSSEPNRKRFISDPLNCPDYNPGAIAGLTGVFRTPS